MKAKMRKPIVEEKFYPIDITLETKEEAEVLWAFLNLCDYSTREMLREEYPNIPNRDLLVGETIDMFYTLENEFTPAWYDRERKD